MKEALSIAAIFGCAAILVSVGILFSQTEPLNIRYEPQAKSERSAEGGRDAERGSKDAPLVVELVNRQKPEAEAAKEDAERQEDRIYTRLTARYTGFAALFAGAAFLAAALQVLLFGWQLGMMREAIADANAAAKAATATVLTMRHGERAYVKISQIPPGLTLDVAAEQARMVFEIKNLGRTPAHVSDVLIKLVLLGAGERLPPEPDYSQPDRRLITDAFLPSGDHFFHVQRRSMSAEIIAMVEAGIRVAYVIGYVDYKDAFGAGHRAGYARMYAPRLNRRAAYESDAEFAKRSNLVFLTQAGYTYDRPHRPDEGNDWGEQT